MFSFIPAIERYPTYQVFLVAVVALVLSGALFPLWIRLLRYRNIGQQVRADGPQGHLVKQGKGVIRSLAHQSTSDGKLHRAERRTGRANEPTLCERCGAVLVRRSWRRGTDLKPSHAVLAAG